jgi:hypothetical protein
MTSFEISFEDMGVTAMLQAAGGQLPGKVRDAVKSSGDSVIKTMKADASKSGSFRFAGRISGEMKGNAGTSIFEGGPVKGGAGSLANIAYFGGAHGGGGTVRDPQQALNEEAPKFEKSIGDAVEDLLS